jgi:DNA-binding response OmpR family regulator
MKNSKKPFQILIVDDDESQLALISRFLQIRIGADVDEVEVAATTNIEMAIGLAVANRVDICLTDLDMPEKNGLEILKVFKDTNPLIFVIVLTAIASENALKSELALGADDYILKPLHWDSLVASVQFQITRLKRYRRGIISVE